MRASPVFPAPKKRPRRLRCRGPRRFRSLLCQKPRTCARLAKKVLPPGFSLHDLRLPHNGSPLTKFQERDGKNSPRFSNLGIQSPPSGEGHSFAESNFLYLTTEARRPTGSTFAAQRWGVARRSFIFEPLLSSLSRSSMNLRVIV